MNQETTRSTTQLCSVGGQHLEYRWLGPQPTAAPTIVFLHEGLGSTTMWRDFPDRVAAATGCGALVYSRRGYGTSAAAAAPWPTQFMHDEALEVLPRVLRLFNLNEVILFGHSDGASIALIYAGSGALFAPPAPPARSAPPAPVLRALILLAPHVFVEDVCIDSIARIDQVFDRTDLPRRLARYHGENTRSMFKSWTDVWLRPEFRAWNIEEYVRAVTVPVLVIQGADDEYGTLRQLDAVVSQVNGPAESLVLPRCGHSPHLDQRDAVLEATTRFVSSTW